MADHNCIDLCEQLEIDSQLEVYLISSPAMLSEIKLKISYNPTHTSYVLLETVGDNPNESNYSLVWMVTGSLLTSCEGGQYRQYLSLIRQIAGRMHWAVARINQISEVEYRSRYDVDGYPVLAKLVVRDYGTRRRSFVSRNVQYTATIRDDKPQAFEEHEITINPDKLISIPACWGGDERLSKKMFTIKSDIADLLAEHLYNPAPQPVDVTSFTTWDDEVYDGILTGTDIPEVQMLIAKATQNHSFPKAINVPHIRWGTGDGIERVGLLLNIGHEAEGRQCLTWMILTSYHHLGGRTDMS